VNRYTGSKAEALRVVSPFPFTVISHRSSQTTPARTALLRNELIIIIIIIIIIITPWL
jgi:hypothetical protein